MWAAEYADLETVRLMMNLGADVNHVSEPNMNGWQSYHTALEHAQGEPRSRRRRSMARDVRLTRL